MPHRTPQSASASALAALLLLLPSSASAFAPSSPRAAGSGPTAVPAFFARPTTTSTASSSLAMSDPASSSSFGSVEEISFKIYPDGRVEETVSGIRGESCHDVTETINGMLGKVTASAPTEEMYENEVVVTNTVEDKVDAKGGDAGGGWEGSSSW